MDKENLEEELCYSLSSASSEDHPKDFGLFFSRFPFSDLFTFSFKRHIN